MNKERLEFINEQIEDKQSRINYHQKWLKAYQMELTLLLEARMREE